MKRCFILLFLFSTFIKANNDTCHPHCSWQCDDPVCIASCEVSGCEITCKKPDNCPEPKCELICQKPPCTIIENL
jgi:hypothetical protein